MMTATQKKVPRHPGRILLLLLLQTELVPVHLVQDARLAGQLEPLGSPARRESFEGVRGLRSTGQ